MTKLAALLVLTVAAVLGLFQAPAAATGFVGGLVPSGPKAPPPEVVAQVLAASAADVVLVPEPSRPEPPPAPKATETPSTPSRPSTPATTVTTTTEPTEKAAVLAPALQVAAGDPEPQPGRLEVLGEQVITSTPGAPLQRRPATTAGRQLAAVADDGAGLARTGASTNDLVGLALGLIAGGSALCRSSRSGRHARGRRGKHERTGRAHARPAARGCPAMVAASALPRWDVTDVFPAIASREYAAAREALGASLTRLAGLYDEHDVRGGDEPLPADDANARLVDDVIVATNEVLDDVRRLFAYLSSFVSTDARDDNAQGELSALQAELSALQLLRTRFDAWIARFDHGAITAASNQAADHAYPIEQSREKAAHQMGEAEEGLLADLQLTGSTAWQRLYQTFTSQIVVHIDGEDEPRSMSQTRGLAYHADAKVRRAAYEAELAAWEANAVPIVAALNAIKGETSLVHRRRGYQDDLEPALLANNVDRATLDAMQGAVVASLSDFGRYLKAKARLLGSGGSHAGAGLAFYDLFAPVAEGAQGPWDAATGAVERAFGSYSPRLAGLARRAVDEQWIDAEPRNGKRDGAFCMSLDGDRSLVFVNYDGSFRSVQTLAHELGHAYHNVTLADRTALQRQLPMALAETASIFCETVMVEAGMKAAAEDGAGTADRLVVIEGDLSAACQVVVDIHSRFLFESAFFEARRKRTLSVKETCALMLGAQEAAYGDGLDPGARHAFMWAAKPHYYGRTFYNWPYTFGLLFGLGLYARYREDPDRFRASYDDLLSSCGLASARELAGRFGIDVADEGFWTASLDVIRRRIDEFVGIVEGVEG